MATDAVRYRRGAREASARAQKARRDKIVLGVGCALLAAIGAFEGPKTLKRLHGSSASSTPAPAIVPTSPAAAVPVAPPKPVSLKPLARFAAKDPFVPQVVSAPSKPTPVLPNNPPKVRTSHWVQKDPFVQQISIAAAGPVGGGSSSSSGSQAAPVAGSGAYIVVVASVPIAAGRAEANHEAAAARVHGVPSVKIVVSSDYPTLREGYYAVYSGPYPTLAKALAAVAQVRGAGYVSAYTRRLGH